MTILEAQDMTVIDQQQTLRSVLMTIQNVMMDIPLKVVMTTKEIHTKVEVAVMIISEMLKYHQEATIHHQAAVALIHL